MNIQQLASALVLLLDTFNVAMLALTSGMHQIGTSEYAELESAAHAARMNLFNDVAANLETARDLYVERLNAGISATDLQPLRDAISAARAEQSTLARMQAARLIPQVAGTGTKAAQALAKAEKLQKFAPPISVVSSHEAAPGSLYSLITPTAKQMIEAEMYVLPLANLADDLLFAQTPEQKAEVRFKIADLLSEMCDKKLALPAIAFCYDNKLQLNDRLLQRLANIHDSNAQRIVVKQETNATLLLIAKSGTENDSDAAGTLIREHSAKLLAVWKVYTPEEMDAMLSELNIPAQKDGFRITAQSLKTEVQTRLTERAVSVTETAVIEDSPASQPPTIGNGKKKKETV